MGCVQCTMWISLFAVVNLALILVASESSAKPVWEVLENASQSDGPGSCFPRADISGNIRNDILSSRSIVELIASAVQPNGSFVDVVWKKLAYFVDTFGHRFTGSENLERSIDYLVSLLQSEGIGRVYTENVSVPVWVRQKEYAYLLTPRTRKLVILGLGNSVSTPPEGITSNVLVVRSFEELTRKKKEASGKIVVFDENFVTYAETVQYRSNAANVVASYGGVAVLVRSVTPFSINSPHTGALRYNDKYKQIPAACITLEDAELLYRLASRGENITIHLYMEAFNNGTRMSRNIIVELEGREKPKESVIVSGHLDSWDVGQGALDDGAGAFISWNALCLLKSLNLIPKRTIKAILFTAEELGYVGSKAYFDNHQDDLDYISLVMESDFGTNNPRGIFFSGSFESSCIMREIINQMSPLNATEMILSKTPGSDITWWTNEGIPGAGLFSDDDRYFWFHHSEGDTIEIIDSQSLDRGTALFASVAYIVADMKTLLPR